MFLWLHHVYDVIKSSAHLASCVLSRVTRHSALLLVLSGFQARPWEDRLSSRIQRVSSPRPNLFGFTKNLFILILNTQRNKSLTPKHISSFFTIIRSCLEQPTFPHLPPLARLPSGLYLPIRVWEKKGTTSLGIFFRQNCSWSALSLACWLLLSIK